MTVEQITLLSLFAAVMGLMMHGRLRHDLVAFGGLLIGVVLGLVPADQAFSGFSHPAVMTVALVLIVSAGLIRTGAVQLLGGLLSRPEAPVPVHIGRIGVVGTVLSAFMNNVTALAILMPIDMMTARKAGRAVAMTLMPLAFATILGGMLTLIGTPPNLIVSGFRQEALGSPFAMFDFAWVGGLVALAGLAFIALVGWRLIPVRQEDSSESDPANVMRDFVAELVVPEESRAAGMTRREIDVIADKADATLIAVQRRGKRVYGRAGLWQIELGDILVIEATPAVLEELRLELQLAYPDGLSADAPRVAEEGEALIEVVVTEASRISGHTARQLHLSRDHDSVLLGILRQGRTIRSRLRDTRVLPGDILLLLAPETREESLIAWLRVLPLERRENVLRENRAMMAVGMFALAIAMVSFGLLDMPVALGLVALGYVLTRILNVEELYDHVDWPVIVLLAAMIPLGLAMDTTGTSAVIAGGLIRLTEGQPAWVALLLLMVSTMCLSDMLNNNATTILAVPVGLRLAEATGTNPDSYLMGIAVAASCAFLTPIGHQNNTIILGPGGYRFGDYWRLGLPLEIIVLAVGVPAILMFWPL
ncbi:SLC13 family permease [Szabonella alba]|uniref:SLC13 family permease n=1 Tax=Szabonella alba TaxID=2804194 RepID=A0A8K0VAL1_9RHOB|nr:SLC13 family permease [Szabonella alba]MBL4916678.1 SLC13 family permease [Szabonella alba]